MSAGYSRTKLKSNGSKELKCYVDNIVVDIICLVVELNSTPTLLLEVCG